MPGQLLFTSFFFYLPLMNQCKIWSVGGLRNEVLTKVTGSLKPDPTHANRHLYDSVPKSAVILPLPAHLRQSMAQILKGLFSVRLAAKIPTRYLCLKMHPPFEVEGGSTKRKWRQQRRGSNSASLHKCWLIRSLFYLWTKSKKKSSRKR